MAPNPRGFNGHNRYGRTARLDDASFGRHVAAFAGVLAARTAGIMPTYAIVDGVTVDGRPLEPVGTGFSRQMLGDLLRGRYGYRGLVVSDWAITNDCDATCIAPSAKAPQCAASIGMPWGVEALSKEARFAKAADAGIDQFGGVNDPAPLLAAVRADRVPMTRIDDAVARVLRLKFELGLLDRPYVDAAAAARIVGAPAAQREADRAQRAAIVALRNRDGIIPLVPGRKVWLDGIAPAAARAAGLIVVERLADADVAIVRAATPFEKLHPDNFFGSRQNEGRLDFRDGDSATRTIRRASATVPTIVAVDMIGRRS